MVVVRCAGHVIGRLCDLMVSHLSNERSTCTLVGDHVTRFGSWNGDLGSGADDSVALGTACVLYSVDVSSFVASDSGAKH